MRSVGRPTGRSVGGRVSGPGDRASRRSNMRGPTRSSFAEGHDGRLNKVDLGSPYPPESKSSARSHMPHAREPGDLGRCPAVEAGGGQAREGEEPQAVGVRTPQPQASEESDALVVPTCKKSANPWVTPGESMEGRSAANGKSARGNADGTQGPKSPRLHHRVGRRGSEQELSLPLTEGGSPVREIRSPGSVRGAARKGRPYRDQGTQGKEERGFHVCCTKAAASIMCRAMSFTCGGVSPGLGSRSGELD